MMSSRAVVQPRARGGLRLWAAVVVLAALSACAPKAPPAAVGPDRYPDFVYPQVPDDLAQAAAASARSHQNGWRWLQAGQLRNAERSFSDALKRSARFYPAVAALGYVGLARQEPANALKQFEQALAHDASYVPALLGRGEAQLALQQEAAALASFEAALKLDPSLPGVPQRVDVLRFRAIQGAVDTAQRAAGLGEYEQARAAYEQAIAASPQSAFLYRDLADVELKIGRLDQALEYARKAIELDPGDRAAHIVVADALEARDDLEGALAALERAQALDGSTETAKRMESMRERIAVAALPPQYHLIGGAPRLTRGELAAALGVRLEPLLQLSRRRNVPVVTDARGHWAQRWIAAVTRAGIMDTYANHTFQPNAPVRRSDLASVVNRLLSVIATRDRTAATQWAGARYAFSDIGPGHLAYPAASAAVASGVLAPDEGNAFRPSRHVTGQEGLAAVERLETLARRALSNHAGR